MNKVNAQTSHVEVYHRIVNTLTSLDTEVDSKNNQDTAYFAGASAYDAVARGSYSRHCCWAGGRTPVCAYQWKRGWDDAARGRGKFLVIYNTLSLDAEQAIAPLAVAELMSHRHLYSIHESHRLAVLVILSELINASGIPRTEARISYILSGLDGWTLSFNEGAITFTAQTGKSFALLQLVRRRLAREYPALSWVAAAAKGIKCEE